MGLHRIKRSRDNPSWRIIEYLQRHDAATIKDLTELLGLTTTAVRRHLTILQSEGYVERRQVASGVGRPHHAYLLTDKADELFACHCDDLAMTLLEEFFALEGQERTGILLDRVSSRLAERYAADMRATILEDRVEELAAALHERGVLADVVIREDEEIMLQTYNCPYHELAQEHREICEMDQDMMRKALGSNIDLTACMVDGDGRCSFIVTSREG